MQLSYFVLSVLSATVLAKDHHDGGGRNSTQAQCKRYLREEKLVQIAGNDTLLAQITENNATKIDYIKKKAAEVMPKIEEAKKNATLMTSCEQVRAVQHDNGQCRFMRHQERLQKLVANETALNEMTKNNATKADKLKQRAQMGMAHLTDLQKNQTILQYCAAKTTSSECSQMRRINKLVALSKNETAMNEKFKGNATKIEAFKAKVAKKQGMLSAMMNNSTLVNVCQKEQKKGGGKGNSQGGIDSGAAGVRAAGALSLAAVVSVVVGLMM